MLYPDEEHPSDSRSLCDVVPLLFSKDVSVAFSLSRLGSTRNGETLTAVQCLLFSPMCHVVGSVKS